MIQKFKLGINNWNNSRSYLERNQCRLLRLLTKWLWTNKRTKALSTAKNKTQRPNKRNRKLKRLGWGGKAQGPRLVSLFIQTFLLNIVWHVLIHFFWKTAKNNSEYIYYSKYKEIGAGSGPENSSKNGTTPGANNDSKKRKGSVNKITKNQCDQDKGVNESVCKSTSFHLDRDTSNNDER
jgi:hypothetical protein